MPIRVLILVLALFVAALAPAMAAPPPRPIAPGSTTSGDIDLAALVLRPNDVDYQGAHFWYDWGYYGTVDDWVATIVDRTGDDRDDVRAALQGAGWAQYYFIRLVTPSGDDPSLARAMVYSGITRFADERGAESGFDLLATAFTGNGHVPVFEADALGEESLITRRRVTGTDGPSGRLLNVVIRQETFVVHFSITDYTDDPPSSELVPRIGEMLLERIERSAMESGLSNRALIVTGGGMVTEHASYRRLQNEQIAGRGQGTDEVRAEDELYEDAGVQSVFQTRQWALIPGGSDDFFDLKLALIQFGTIDEASAGLRDWTRSRVENPPAGFVEVRRLLRATEFGDESVTISYGFDRGQAGVTRGYLISVRTGDALVQLIGDALAGADLAAMEEIAAAAVECVTGSDGCAPMELPPVLVEGRTDAG